LIYETNSPEFEKKGLELQNEAIQLKNQNNVFRI